MKSVDAIGFTFASCVVGYGHKDGIVNLTLGAQPFDPIGNGLDPKVDPEIVVTARLRLDEPAARNLRDILSAVLTSLDSAKVMRASDTAPEPLHGTEH